MEDAPVYGKPKNETISKTSMKWYHYVAVLFAGAFLTNAVPHFVNGISGHSFPTPFANPPGKGLSSPLINILWAVANLLVGYLLLRLSKMNAKDKLAVVIFFLGVFCISITLSIAFTDLAK